LSSPPYRRWECTASCLISFLALPLTQKYFPELLFLFRKGLGIEVFHLHIADLVGARKRRIDTLAIGEFAVLRENFHALVNLEKQEPFKMFEQFQSFKSFRSFRQALTGVEPACQTIS